MKGFLATRRGRASDPGRRISALLLVLLLLVGAVPGHGEHSDPGHSSGSQGMEAAHVGEARDAGAETSPSAHASDASHHGHAAHDLLPADAHDPSAEGDPHAPCPRGPCPAGAPACAATLGAPALPDLAPASVLAARSPPRAGASPPSVLAEPPFRPPRGDTVTPRPTHAG